MSTPRLAVLVSFSGQGGVERSFALLVNAMVDLGIRVDLLLIKRSSPHLALVSHKVNRIALKHQHAATCSREVASYLTHTQPDALLVAKHRAIVAATKAALKANYQRPVVGVIGINTSASIAARLWPHRFLWRLNMRRYYPQVTRLIAVSDGVNADLCELAGLPGSQVVTIRNPVVDDSLRALAEEPVDHPWVKSNDAPIIVSVGRLSHSKDYETLLRAMSLLDDRAARLVILGEGGDRLKLEQLICDLRLEGRVHMPGFVDNPFSWMRAAKVFALSSVIEGSGNVLVEAMAQTAGILGFKSMGKTPADGSIYYLVGVDNLRFKRPCVPGDRVHLHAEIESERRGIWKFAVRAEVDGQLCASATILCADR